MKFYIYLVYRIVYGYNVLIYNKIYYLQYEGIKVDIFINLSYYGQKATCNMYIPLNLNRQFILYGKSDQDLDFKASFQLNMFFSLYEYSVQFVQLFV